MIIFLDYAVTAQFTIAESFSLMPDNKRFLAAKRPKGRKGIY